MAFSGQITGTQFIEIGPVPAQGLDRLGRIVDLGDCSIEKTAGPDDLVEITTDAVARTFKVLALRNAPAGTIESVMLRVHVDGNPGPEVFDVTNDGVIEVISANAASFDVPVGAAQEQ